MTTHLHPLPPYVIPMCELIFQPPHDLYLPHQELNVFRSKCGMLFHYDWISVPLVYTQVTWLGLFIAHVRGSGGLVSRKI